jgi:Tol biopolymer transport system component
VANSDGTRPVQLTSIDGAATGSPSWSPDGRWIVFDSRLQGRADIYVISAEGGTPRLLTVDSHNTIPSWSQDGRHVYFSSTRGSGQQMWKLPLEGGNAVQVTHSVANACFESSDGRLLYFSKVRGALGIWYMPVAGGEEKHIDEIDKGIYGRSWGLLKKGIFFIAPGTERCTVYFFSFTTRRVTPLLTLDKWPPSDLPSLAISPDGRALLHMRVDHEVADIMLIENFR